MLNLNNMDKISKILGMEPEDITRYDIKAGTKKYGPETNEGWELILALRELDNGKTEKLNQKAEECERKMAEEREKIEFKKQFKPVKMFITAMTSFMCKINKKFNKKIIDVNKIADEEELNLDLDLDEMILLSSSDDCDINERQKEILSYIMFKKALDYNNEARKNNKIEWLKIKAIEALIALGYMIVVTISLIVKLVYLVISSLINVKETLFG